MCNLVPVFKGIACWLSFLTELSPPLRISISSSYKLAGSFGFLGTNIDLINDSLNLRSIGFVILSFEASSS